MLARFEPIRDWRVIGPFPRTTAQIFIGRAVDRFHQVAYRRRGPAGQVGAAPGRPGDRPRRPDDFKRGPAIAADSATTTAALPTLAPSATPRSRPTAPDLRSCLVGSSGPLIVTVNEQPVYQYNNVAGRAYAPDTDLVRFDLQKGRNRILVVSRQGIGPWCFGLQIGRLAPRIASTASGAGLGSKRCGDSRWNIAAIPQEGKDDLLRPQGVGCAQCHSAGGRGESHDRPGPDRPGVEIRSGRGDPVGPRAVQSDRDRAISPSSSPPATARLNPGSSAPRTSRRSSWRTRKPGSQRIPKSDIEARRVGDVSMMPAKLVESLSPAEFADLISYLLSLKNSR